MNLIIIKINIDVNLEDENNNKYDDTINNDKYLTNIVLENKNSFILEKTIWT